jgi:rRNA maturation endonuclease Nob1
MVINDIIKLIKT